MCTCLSRFIGLPYLCVKYCILYTYLPIFISFFTMLTLSRSLSNTFCAQEVPSHGFDGWVNVYPVPACSRAKPVGQCHLHVTLSLKQVELDSYGIYLAFFFSSFFIHFFSICFQFLSPAFLCFFFVLFLTFLLFWYTSCIHYCTHLPCIYHIYVWMFVSDLRTAHQAVHSLLRIITWRRCCALSKPFSILRSVTGHHERHLHSSRCSPPFPTSLCISISHTHTQNNSSVAYSCCHILKFSSQLPREPGVRCSQ